MLAYPDGLYQYVFATSFFQLQHIYFAMRYGQRGCALMGVSLFGTSLVYWYNPLLNSWRRVIDMWTAHSTIAYHAYLAVTATTEPMLCGSLIAVGASMYPLSTLLMRRGWGVGCGVACHCLLHVIVSIGASTTYAHMI
jgi:hypothetical protein